MQLKGDFHYLGIETFHGRQNPNEVYASLALLQGTAVTKIFLEKEQQSEITNLSFKQMDKVSCILDINIGQKTYLKLVEIKKAA
jgi:hypothetical protein